MVERAREASPELAESRRLMEEYAKVPDSADATSTDREYRGVPVLEILTTGADSDLTVLHLHGGAYRRGSPNVFGFQLARIAKSLGIPRLVGVKYGLAPERPFPAGLDDALAVYEHLLESTPAERIVVWGDSAGGGLAAALLLRIGERALPRPRGAVLLSPWADLRVTATSFAENAKSDSLFSRANALEAAEEYLAGQEPSDPRISAVLGDWSGQPPILVLASRAEVLRDDAIELTRAAAAAGVSARLELVDGVQHIWPVMDFPRTEESIAAIETIRDFLRSDLRLANALSVDA